MTKISFHASIFMLHITTFACATWLLTCPCPCELLFVAPSGPPQNCINNTFNSQTVELQWEEPVRALQNGWIRGYNLTCVAYGPCADLSANLSSTQTSTAVPTNYIIDPVSPFTEYTCSLSAINEVGEGPSIQCIFTTKQDGKTLRM